MPRPSQRADNAFDQLGATHDRYARVHLFTYVADGTYELEYVSHRKSELRKRCGIERFE